VGFQESFKALSDPTRREILNLLRAGPMSAGEILEHFQMTGASLSHHLSILKNAGLIDDEKKGKYIFYTLNTSVLEDIMNWMISLTKSEKENES
jgi:DNA-binding transcriptional ArsR family regulator